MIVLYNADTYNVCIYTQAFAWSADSIGRAMELFGDEPFVGRHISLSSAYSGIGTIEQSAHQVCHCLSGVRGPHTTHALWALEKDAVCQAELVSYFGGFGCDTCVFGNLKELIPRSWWADLGFAAGAAELELPPTQLYAKRLHHTLLMLDGRHCAAHVGRCTCKLRRSDVHIAGTTCVDHSSYGSCTGDEGRNVKCFLIWCALMRQLCPCIILHENVAGFGTVALHEALGDVYAVCPSVSCASRMGYPIRRKRQMTILVLKAWIYPQLRDAGMASSCNPHDVRNLVDLQRTLDALSKRPCQLTWKDFTVASAEDMREEVAEAARRPGVVRRWAEASAGKASTTDKTGKACRVFAGDRGCPTLEALLPMERERIESVLWQDSPGVDVIDVSQNPDKRARVIKSGEHTFMTVIAGSGYLVRTDLMRQELHTTTLVTASDILSMSGFPITDEQVRHAGVPCMFSRSRAGDAPQCRSPKSMKKQIGNAMHFTHVGLMFFIALAKFRGLGAIVPSDLPGAISTQKRKREDDSDAESVASSGSAASSASPLLMAVRARRIRAGHQLPAGR